MVDKGIEGETDCEQLETKGRGEAFKVGLDLEELQKYGGYRLLAQKYLSKAHSFLSLKKTVNNTYIQQ